MLHFTEALELLCWNEEDKPWVLSMTQRQQYENANKVTCVKEGNRKKNSLEIKSKK